jgi:hypothetical protein
LLWWCQIVFLSVPAQRSRAFGDGEESAGSGC